MRTILLAQAVAAMVLPSAVQAKTTPPIVVESKAVADKPAVHLDPGKAYILMRSAAQVPMLFVKMPTASEQAAYDALRQSELEKAKAKYVRKLASYQRDVAAAAKMPRGSVPVPDKPVEPTDATFSIAPIATMATVEIGPMNRFAKGERSTYLQAVTPGTYRLYGSMILGAGDQATTGLCYCMGSVKFEAKAGEIVDLGFIPDADPVKPTPGDSAKPIDLSKQVLFQRLDASTIDPRLTAYKVVPVQFRPVGKIPNYWGVTISRVPAMAGVMRYERDRIVDLTAGR